MSVWDTLPLPPCELVQNQGIVHENGRRAPVRCPAPPTLWARRAAITTPIVSPELRLARGRAWSEDPSGHDPLLDSTPRRFSAEHHCCFADRGDRSPQDIRREVSRPSPKSEMAVQQELHEPRIPGTGHTRTKGPATTSTRGRGSKTARRPSPCLESCCSPSKGVQQHGVRVHTCAVLLEPPSSICWVNGVG